MYLTMTSTATGKTRLDGKAEIGDPAVDREHWRMEDLEVLWHGDGMRVTTAPIR